MPCVIKYEYDNGNKLPRHKQELWCGNKRTGFDWCFIDAQHAALADKPVCRSCVKAISDALKGKES